MKYLRHMVTNQSTTLVCYPVVLPRILAPLGAMAISGFPSSVRVSIAIRSSFNWNRLQTGKHTNTILSQTRTKQISAACAKVRPMKEGDKVSVYISQPVPCWTPGELLVSWLV